MQHSTGTPTKAEAQRIETAKELGCICCWLLERPSIPADYHHIVRGNKRLGHRYGFALCSFHHQGYPYYGYNVFKCQQEFGPSLAHGSKPFHERWGTNQELLWMQDCMLRAAGLDIEPVPEEHEMHHQEGE